MYDINGELINNKTLFDQLGQPFKLFTPDLLQTFLEEGTREPRRVVMTQPMAFQIKNKDFTPWLHFIPSRKAYDQGCLLYLVEADPLGTGDTLLKVGLTLESDPMRRDPKAFKRVLSQFQVPAGINPMVVEHLTHLCCSRVGATTEHAYDVIDLIVGQTRRWGGWTELVKSTDPVVATTFDTIAPRICDYLIENPDTAALQEWNLVVHLWKVKHKHFSNKVCYGCTYDPHFDFAIKPKGLSRRTAQRTVQQAYALIREDIDQCNVEKTDLVAQAIHLLMESARMGLAQNNPGAVVGAVSQLDKLCGLSPSRRG